MYLKKIFHKPFFWLLFSCSMLNTACRTQRELDPIVTHPDTSWNMPEMEMPAREPNLGLAASGRPRLEAKKIEDTQYSIPDSSPSFSESQALNEVSNCIEPKKDILDEAYTEANTPSKYSVKKGDTLWTVAKRHGVLLEDLLSYNGLQKDSVLKIGQVLLIPSVKSPLPSQNTTLAPQEVETYIVQRGDTLSSLSLAAQMTVAELKTFNQLQKETIYLGQKLTLPKGSQERLKNLKKSSPQVQAHPEVPLWPENTYTVKLGDTLSGIAYTQKVSIKVLMDLNGIKDPKALRAGQKLKLPTNPSKTEEASAINTAHPASQELNLVTPTLPENEVSEPLSNIEALSSSQAILSPFSSLNKEEDEAIFNDLTEAPVISLEEAKPES